MSSSTTKRQQRFLPYRFADLGILLRIENCRFDGQATKIEADTERHLLDLSIHTFGQVTISLVATVPNEVFASVLPSTELLAPPARVLVAVRCAATRLRRWLELIEDPLDPSPPPGPMESCAMAQRRYTGELSLERDDLRDIVELTGLLVRTDRSADNQAGRAAEAHQRLASARTWELKIDAGPPPPGEYLDTRQEDFSKADRSRFPDPDVLYQLDCDTEAPILWINSKHHRVAGVLHSTANTGRNARIRDAVFDRIEATVWPRLFLRAAHSLQKNQEVSFAWQAAVLRKWLPVLYPQHRDHEGQLFALKQELESDDGALLDRLDLALQRQTTVARHLDLIIEEIEP